MIITKQAIRDLLAFLGPMTYSELLARIGVRYATPLTNALDDALDEGVVFIKNTKDDRIVFMTDWKEV